MTAIAYTWADTWQAQLPKVQPMASTMHNKVQDAR